MNDINITKQNQTWTLARTLEQDCLDQAFHCTRDRQVDLMTVLIPKRKYVIIKIIYHSLTYSGHISIGVLLNLFHKYFSALR